MRGELVNPESLEIPAVTWRVLGKLAANPESLEMPAVDWRDLRKPVTNSASLAMLATSTEILEIPATHSGVWDWAAGARSFEGKGWGPGKKLVPWGVWP